MPAISQAAISATVATIESDKASGTARVSFSGANIPRASLGAYVLTHDTRYMPSFYGPELTGKPRPIWGGYFAASPNPFR